MTTEKPILFSGPMVRAILEGRKTQTRRIVKEQPPEGSAMTADWYFPTITNKSGEQEPGAKVFGAYSDDGEWGEKCPYGEPGTRLWVRETWEQVEHIGGHGEPLNNSCRYRADYDQALGRWRPSIHMPRWASRITLEISEIRVERLQEISEADAKAEGCDGNCPIGYMPAYQAGPMAYHYAQLWESINGKGSWDLNPYVWVIGFKRVEGVTK